MTVHPSETARIIAVDLGLSTAVKPVPGRAGAIGLRFSFSLKMVQYWPVVGHAGARYVSHTRGLAK